MYSVGIDIGGTYIKAGLVKDQKLVVKDKIKTIAENNEDKIIAELKSLVEGLLAKAEADKIQNIGIGIAGSSKNGICLYMANTPWRNIDLNKLGKIFACKVTVVNDLKGATLGELHFGVGKECKDFVFVGLGTGLNIGVVKGEYIIDGVEFGHVTVDRGGETCGCGKRGCLESIVSTKSFLRYATKITGETSENIKEIFDKAKTDDRYKKVIDEYMTALNVGLMNICNSYRPKLIVLGGGIGEGLREYIDVVNQKLKDGDYGYPSADPTEVIVSNVGNDCGILGCSTLK